jgi:uncharacterized membrane protein
VPESLPSRVARNEARIEGVLRELDRLTRSVETFGPMAGQIIEVIAEVRDIAEDLKEIKADVRGNRQMSTTLKVALIGASGVILAAIIAAVAHSS